MEPKTPQEKHPQDAGTHGESTGPMGAKKPHTIEDHCDALIAEVKAEQAKPKVKGAAGDPKGGVLDEILLPFFLQILTWFRNRPKA